jgi:DNA-binding transcriptional regulator YhcF (GntR family)
VSRVVDKPVEPDLARLVVDRAAEVPIGVQLAWALRARIDDGTLAPGQRLPGLRELADALGVNVNTVRTVYQRLEQTGLIESRQGSGTFISRGLAGTVTSAGKIAAHAARQARARGVDPRAVATALYMSSAGAADTSPGQSLQETPARRRRLREQIASLERALGAIEAEYAAILPPQAPAARRVDVGPSLLTAEELERTRSELMHRLTRVQARIEQHAAAAERRAVAARGRAEPPAPAAAAEKPAAKRRRRRARPSTRPSTRPAPAT